MTKIDFHQYCPIIFTTKQALVVFMWYSLIQFKGYNSKFKFLDGVQFRKYFISLPVFYFTIWKQKMFLGHVMSQKMTKISSKDNTDYT